MDLKTLVQQAIEQSDEFAFKWHYWVVKRQKAPTLDWLMPLLEQALSKSYVRMQARAFLESQDAE